MNEYPLTPVQAKDKAEITHSVIEIPKPRDQCTPSETNSDEVEDEVPTETSVYQ